MKHRRIIVVFTFTLGVAVAASPTFVHAASLWDVITGSSTALGTFMLNMGSELLALVSDLLVGAITSLGRNLQSIIEFHPTYGGATVYKLWQWLRDLSNMLFIAVLVVIAFGTIFNTLKQNAFHYRNALAMFIVAAILINMSFAIGQTIVWAGNQATDLVLDFMPNDVGAQLATSLGTIQVTTTGLSAGKVQVPPAATAEIPLDKLDPSQQALVEAWQTRGTADVSSGLQYLQGCLTDNQHTVDQCFTAAVQINRNVIQTAQEQARQQDVESSTFIKAATMVSEVVYSTGDPTSLSAALSIFGGWLVRTFLLAVLALSFLAITLFMVVRIPAIWFMLALSAVAFFSLAVPPAREQFFRWLKNIVGISFFGPLYLMVIYLGLLILNTQGSLIASGNNINDLPLISSIFGTAFFYFVAAAIFIGGAAAVTKISFSLSPTAGSIFGAIGGALGVSAATGFGIKTVGRGLGAITGTTTATRGLRAGVKQRYERVVKKPLSERQQRFEEEFRTIAAGGEERQKHLRSRIDDRTKRLDQQLKKQTDRAKLRLEQAQASVVRTEAQAQIKGTIKAASMLTSAQRGLVAAQGSLEKLQKRQGERLRSLLQEASTGRTATSNETAIAAGNELLKLQKISTDELVNLQKRYAQISPAALQGFIQQRNQQLQKDAKSRKYSDADEMKGFLGLITDKKEAIKFIDAAKTSKSNKIPAIIAGVNLRLIPGPDGKTPVEDVQKELNRQANQFTVGDILKSTEYLRQEGVDLTKEGIDDKLQQLQSRYARLLKDVDKYADMQATASVGQLRQLQKDRQEFDKLVRGLRSKMTNTTDQQERSDISAHIKRLTEKVKEREPATAGPLTDEEPKKDGTNEKKS